MSESSGSVAQEDEGYVRIAEKMRGCWVGPFPILKFLGLLSDHSELDPSPLPPPDIFSITPVEESNEMNLSLITAFESLGLEKLHFKDTGDHSNPSPPPYKKCRPDISVCSSDTKFGDLKDLAYASKARASPAYFSELVLSFELKRGECDPFSDKPNGLDPCFENAHTEVQGRIAAILNEMLCFTWRTHAFSVFMDDHIARLFRADRAGVLVSEAFDYRKNPEYLTDFSTFSII